MDIATSIFSHNIWFFILIVFLFLVFIGREFCCWYFKINKINTLLEQIEENTRPKNIVREPSIGKI